MSRNARSKNIRPSSLTVAPMDHTSAKKKTPSIQPFLISSVTSLMSFSFRNSSSWQSIKLVRLRTRLALDVGDCSFRWLRRTRSKQGWQYAEKKTVQMLALLLPDRLGEVVDVGLHQGLPAECGGLHVNHTATGHRGRGRGLQRRHVTAWDTVCGVNLVRVRFNCLIDGSF